MALFRLTLEHKENQRTADSIHKDWPCVNFREAARGEQAWTTRTPLDDECRVCFR
jgi:hypothetical protein